MTLVIRDFTGRSGDRESCEARIWGFRSNRRRDQPATMTATSVRFTKPKETRTTPDLPSSLWKSLEGRSGARRSWGCEVQP